MICPRPERMEKYRTEFRSLGKKARKRRGREGQGNVKSGSELFHESVRRREEEEEVR